MADRAPSEDPRPGTADASPGTGASSGTVVIRPLTAADLEQVAEIEEASFATPWSRETFENLLARRNARLLAAVDPDDRLLGYAVLWFAGGQSELGDLAVHPGARRRGIGTRLLRAALEESHALEAREMFLEVRAGNLAAQALYRRHGFEIVGRRAGYYAAPREDALVMRRALRPAPLRSR